MMLPLGIECIGDDTARNVIPGLICTADRNHRNFRKATAHDREELESRHLREHSSHNSVGNW